MSSPFFARSARQLRAAACGRSPAGLVFLSTNCVRESVYISFSHIYQPAAPISSCDLISSPTGDDQQDSSNNVKLKSPPLGQSLAASSISRTETLEAAAV